MALASLEIKFNGHKATANKRLLFVCSLVGRGLTLGIHPDPAGDPDPRNPCSLFLWKSKKSRAQLWNYFNFGYTYAESRKRKTLGDKLAAPVRRDYTVPLC